MSDHERWNETRRLGPEGQPPDDTAGGFGDRGEQFGDPGRTSRLPPSEASGGEGAEPTQRLDAVGDSTYEDPEGYGDPYAATAYDEVETETGAPLEEEEGRNRWATILLVLLGIGIGFVAALLIVALFGGETGDADAIAQRDARIDELEEEAEANEQELENLEATVEQRDEQIEDLQGGMADAEGDLAQRQQELDDREQQLDQREQQLDDREQSLDEREQELDDREEDLAEREQEEPGQEPDDQPSEDGEGNGEGNGDGNGDDFDLPDVDDVDEDAEAFIDRVIEGIRDLFR